MRGRNHDFYLTTTADKTTSFRRISAETLWKAEKSLRNETIITFKIKDCAFSMNTHLNKCLYLEIKDYIRIRQRQQAGVEE